MPYQPGDYVYPADLPRPFLCRVVRAEDLASGTDIAQMLRLEPLEGPWPAGTSLVRLDEHVLPACPRALWRTAPRRRLPTPPRRMRLVLGADAA